MKRLLAFLLLDRGDRLVKVKSWRPSWGDHGIEWPAMLIDSPIGRRSGTPCWNKARFRDVWQRLRGWDEARRYQDAMVRSYGPNWDKPASDTSTPEWLSAEAIRHIFRRHLPPLRLERK